MATAWNIDPTHSAIHFSVRHMMFSKVRGRFTRWNGKLDLDPANPSRSSVAVEIDAASIDTSEAQRDGHLRSPDFLDAERFPSIAFRSKAIEDKGPGRLRIRGDLTIHGVTREVSLDAQYGGRVRDPWGNDRVGYSASASIDRTDFGLGWNQALEAGGILVGTKVEIELEIEAVAAAAKTAQVG